MTHRRRHIRPEEPSFSDDFDSESDSTISDSDSESEESIELFEKTLSKRDFKKLIKLEKKIKKQEKILRKQKRRESKKIKKSAKKVDRFERQSEQSIERILQKIDNKPTVEEGKKLFITGIDDKYEYEEVMKQLGLVLKDIDGVKGYRVKHKKGSKTYAFVDFSNYEDAKQALQQLKRRTLFGNRIAIYYSQDQLKSKSYEAKKLTKTIKCFQCQGEGHFARQCTHKMKNMQKPYLDASSLDFNPAFDCGPAETAPQPVNGKSPIDRMIEQNQPNRRVVRERSRLDRFGY